MFRRILGIAVITGAIWYAAGSPNVFGGDGLAGGGASHGSTRGGLGHASAIRLGN